MRTLPNVNAEATKDTKGGTKDTKNFCPQAIFVRSVVYVMRT
jgi:hypothetical protein